MSAIVALTEFQIGNLEDSTTPIPIPLDFNKAFDFLDYKQLTTKMKLRINGKTTDWFQCYFTKRIHLVKLK